MNAREHDDVGFLIANVRSQEKLAGTLYPLAQVKDQLHAIIADDPALEPEVGATFGHLSDACDAIARGVEFIQARLAVRFPER